MAKKPDIKTVASGYMSQETINTNFENIEEAFDNTLSRDGSTPNTMEADLDLNGHSLLNVGDLSLDGGDTLNELVTSAETSATNAATSASEAETAKDAAETAQAAAEAAENSLLEWQGAWATATAYAPSDIVRESGSSYICLEAHTSGTFSTDLSAGKWEIFAQQGAAGAGTGDMLAANNLSDVDSAATSRSNLGLGSIATEDVASFVSTSPEDLPNMTDMDGVGFYYWDSFGERHIIGFGKDSNNLTQISVNKSTGVIYGRIKSGGTWGDEYTIGYIGDISESDWETGTSTVKSVISPAHLKAAIDANTNSIGVGQTWQDVRASRTAGTTYQNTTGKPIMVSLQMGSTTGRKFQVSSDGATWVDISRSSSASYVEGSAIVPNNHYYRIDGSITVNEWSELR